MFRFLRRKKRDRDSYESLCRRRSRAEREAERQAAQEWAWRAQIRKKAGTVPPPPAAAELVAEGVNERLRWRVLQVLLTHPAATQADFEDVWPLVRRKLLERYTLSRLESAPFDVGEL